MKALTDEIGATLGRLTWRRLLLTLALFALMNAGIAAARLPQRHLAELSMPPSFRHMDEATMRVGVQDYLAAQDIGPHCVLVMGDCVTFGHGVRQSYTDFLEYRDRRVVNLSMQSLHPALTLLIVEEAGQAGVRDFIFQLHPFEHYSLKTAVDSFWRRSNPDEHGRPLPGEPDLPALDDAQLMQFAREQFRAFSLSMIPSKKLWYGPFKDAVWEASTVLRLDLLSRLPAYRQRFLIDTFYGLRHSTYSDRWQRIDSYTRPLPPARQASILGHPDREAFFAAFKVEDPQAFQDEQARFGLISALASYFSRNGMTAVFFMVPTIVDVVDANTVIEARDLRDASSAYRAIVEAHGLTYLDYLEEPQLSNHMRHFDNLTVEGQRRLADRLNADLISRVQADE